MLAALEYAQQLGHRHLLAIYNVATSTTECQRQPQWWKCPEFFHNSHTP
jgi:hypothetical protein